MYSRLFGLLKGFTCYKAIKSQTSVVRAWTTIFPHRSCAVRHPVYYNVPSLNLHDIFTFGYFYFPWWHTFFCIPLIVPILLFTQVVGVMVLSAWLNLNMKWVIGAERPYWYVKEHSLPDLHQVCSQAQFSAVGFFKKCGCPWPMGIWQCPISSAIQEAAYKVGFWSARVCTFTAQEWDMGNFWEEP